VNEVLSAASLSLGLSATAVTIASLPGVPLAAALGLSRSRRRDVFLVAARVGMSFPTVVVGLLVYGFLSRSGPLGSLGLLYTPQAIVTGEVLLAFPLVVALGASAVGALDPRFRDTARSLRLGRGRTVMLAVSEARDGFTAAILVAFARCVTELGVALLVGGNLRGSTRTLTTAIALETSRGDFARGVRLGLVLVGIALLVNIAVAVAFRRAEGK
jgi:tungstate transport system permease protein